MDTNTIIEVVAADCDSLEHLNHVTAVRYLEDAREDWYSACGLYEGMPPGVYEKSAVVVNINYNYAGECFLGEKVSCLTRGVSMGSKSFTLYHEIIKPDGSVAIQGECTSVIMDINAERGIIPVPECMARHLPKRK